MLVRTPRDLGLLLRQARKDRGWSQQQLADEVGASRHWVMSVERGKSGAELGLILAALAALDLACDVRLAGPPASGGARTRVPVPDLDSILKAAAGKARGSAASAQGMSPRRLGKR